jgi:RNA recognition motif-containing protein
MKRIILIKDKVTMASFGFAFVEFIDTTSAAAVLAATMSPQIHPAGFRISDRPVAASFAHPDSFQPIQEIMLRDEACLTSSLALGGIDGTWVRYWDDTSTVAVLEFQVVMPPPSTAQSAKDKKEKKKREFALRPIAPLAPSALPVSDKPVTLSFNKGPAKSALGSAVKPLSLGFSSDDATEENAVEGDSASDSKAASSKAVAPLIASKKV